MRGSVLHLWIRCMTAVCCCYPLTGNLVVTMCDSWLQYDPLPLTFYLSVAAPPLPQLHFPSSCCLPLSFPRALIPLPPCLPLLLTLFYQLHFLFVLLLSLSLSPSVNCFHWIPNTICPFLSISLAYIPITYYNYNDTSRVQTFAGAFNYISDVPISEVRKSFFTMSFMLWYGIMMVESFVFPDYFDSTLMQQKCAYAQC